MLISPGGNTASPTVHTSPEGRPIQWTAQIVHNLEAALEILNVLLHRENTKLTQNQLALHKVGFFEPLAQHALSMTFPRKVRTAALHCLDLFVFSNPELQQVFSRHVSIQRDRSLPSILLVIRMAVDGEDVALRLAATSMIGSYLGDNADGKLVIAATFKSPRLSDSPSLDDQSAGSVLIERALDLSGIRRDPYRVWFPAVILCHILRDNDQCKSIALSHKEVISEPEQDGEMGISSQSFLYRLLQNLNQSIDDSRQVISSVAYLMLLATWVRGHSPVVAALVSEGSNVQLLIELINQNSTADPMVQGLAAFVFGLIALYNESLVGPFSRQSLAEIVRNRIGYDVFAARILRIRDSFNSSLNERQSVEAPAVFDRAFAEDFLKQYRRVLEQFVVHKKDGRGPSPYYHHPGRMQTGVETNELDDLPLQTLRFETESLKAQVAELQAALSSSIQPPEGHQSNAHEKNLESKCSYLIKENAKLQKTIDAYSTQLLQMEKDNEELLVCLASHEAELKQLRQHLILAEQQRDPSSEGFPLSANPSDTDLITSESGPDAPAASLPAVAHLESGALYHIPGENKGLTKGTIGHLLDATPKPSTFTFDV